MDTESGITRKIIQHLQLNIHTVSVKLLQVLIYLLIYKLFVKDSTIIIPKKLLKYFADESNYGIDEKGQLQIYYKVTDFGLDMMDRYIGKYSNPE